MRATPDTPSIMLVDEIASPLGLIVIAARAGRLCALEFGRPRMARQLAQRYGRPTCRRVRNPFGISTRIRDYLAGKLTAVDDIPVETGGTPFQRRVWRAIRRIRAGHTMSYGTLALALGQHAAARAVGAANGRNPLSIVVPCHRLIGGDGRLTGYGGGLWRKRWLLAHEGAAGVATRRTTPRGEPRTDKRRSPR